MSGTPTPIEAGTELDYLLRCVADGLGDLATAGYAKGASDRGGRVARTITCEPFNGRFTVDELTKAAASSPGMRVSIDRIPKMMHVGDGHVDLTLEFVAAIVTQARSLEWDGLAARTLQAVMTGIHWQNWGTDGSRAPFLFPKTTDVQAENVFGDATTKAGVTMWVLSWYQEARLQAASNIVDGPATLHVKATEPYGPAPLGPVPNRFNAPDRAAAEALRDLSFQSADPTPYDADPTLGIVLTWPVGNNTCLLYQVRRGGAWSDWYTHVRTLADWPA